MIVSIFFDRSVESQSGNAFITEFFEAFDDRYNTQDGKKTIDMTTILSSVGARKGFWMYNGSLTAPPCTEGVKWTIMADVQPISQA